MLESLKINLENGLDADTLLSRRSTLVEKALSENDIKMLKAIAEVDKQNLSLLRSEKNKIMEELARLTKIKNYIG